MSRLIDFFPKEDTPRKNQIEVINEIDSAIQQNERFIIVQCPTGTGKSHIAATLANASKDPDPKLLELIQSNKVFRKSIATGKYEFADDIKAFLPWGTACLTVTKSLQDQYTDLFPFTRKLKGKGNYICNIEPSFTADIAPCTQAWKQGEECLAQNICSYYNELKNTLGSKFSVYNYNKFLSLPSFVRNREFLICDEASEIEDMLVSFFSVTINYKTLAYYRIKYGEKVKTDNMFKNQKWLVNFQENINNEIKNLQSNLYTRKTNKNEQTKDTRKLKICKDLRENLMNFFLASNNSEYVCSYDNDSVTFQPLFVDKVSKYLWARHKHIILMSGTIFDKETFAKTLGIDKFKYIEVDSEFDVDKNPIYVPAKVPLNYKSMETALPIVIKQAQDITKEFKEDNGIIHTHTNKITQEFEKRTPSVDRSRYLFRKDHITNEHILLEHATSENATVLVSPSMAFGIDLPDVQSRFQIVMKMPYPSLGDKRIKMLFERDKAWYNMKTFVKLIQMCGRSCRTPDDYCSTYILDGAAIRSLQQNWKHLPLYFKNRIK